MVKSVQELYTDRYGFVHTHNDLIQIKIWKFHKNSIKLIGTITFYYKYENYIFKGIVNRNNYKIVVDFWSKYCLSDYIVFKYRSGWMIDFLGTKRVFRPRILSNYHQFKKKYPEYRIVKI